MRKTELVSGTTARQSRRFFASLDFVIPVLVLAVTAVVFRRYDWDIAFQQLFHRSGSGWFLKEHPFIRFIYHYGNLPALLLAVAGLALFGLSFQAGKWVKWRKAGAFLALAMLLGPGLVINTALKDHWGRPRPRNVTEFGGDYAYEQVLLTDTSSPGKSFPCGHCSMGFYLSLPWFLLRRKKPGQAVLVLLAGIGAGLLIGLARIAQGGHWLSDVLVAGLLVYLVGAVLFYLLKLNRGLWFYHERMEIDRRQRLIVTFVVSILALFLLLGVALATPYSFRGSNGLEHKNSLHHVTRRPARYHRLDLKLQKADLILLPGNTLRLEAAAQGFGFPGSKIIPQYVEGFDADTLNMFYAQKQKRFFTELDNTLRATWDFRWKGRLDIALEKGSVRLAVPEYADSLTLNVSLGDGTLELDLPASFKPRISMKGDFALADSTGFNSSDNIFVREGFKVNLIVRRGKIVLR